MTKLMIVVVLLLTTLNLISKYCAFKCALGMVVVFCNCGAVCQ